MQVSGDLQGRLLQLVAVVELAILGTFDGQAGARGVDQVNHRQPFWWRQAEDQCAFASLRPLAATGRCCVDHEGAEQKQDLCHVC